AVEHFDRAIDIDPADPATHCELGFLFLETERWDLATDEFSATLLLDPDRARAYLGLGLVAEAQGLRNKAAGLYRRALSIDPDDRIAREKLARITLAE
ncbi:hypothetical protein BV581_21665, partial [Stutzerimonas stutzeri]